MAFLVRSGERVAEPDTPQLSLAAAVGVVARAVSAQQARLCTRFTTAQVEHAQGTLFQASKFQGGALFKSHTGELLELRASNPFDDDYPDVRAQRRAQLDETIAAAQEADRVELPQISTTDLKIAVCGVALAAQSGSPEALDVLGSSYMQQTTEIVVASTTGGVLPPMATD